MTTDLSHFRFVAKALPNQGARPRELARTMPAHPLSYMELPYDPEYTLYNSRLTPEKLDTATDDEMYWAVRTNVIFRHTGELPIEISGPDAETLLNKVFTPQRQQGEAGALFLSVRLLSRWRHDHRWGAAAACGRQILDGAGRRRPVQLVQSTCRGA
jgi:hypothetical protein